MILTIDVGNTTIQGGLFEGEKSVLQFRRSTNASLSSDELGLFLRDVIRLNGFDHTKVSRIACCSVVPAINHSLSKAVVKDVGKEALFIQAGIKTGLKLKYSNPKEIGADRIAAAIGAIAIKKDTDLIIVDMGTATTVDVVTAGREYSGGAIIPGIGMSVHSLADGTAQLPSVEVKQPEKICGTSTIEAIQSGIFFGQAGAIRELCVLFEKNVFGGKRPYIIGTGGFARLFENYGIFDQIVPDLVLRGLLTALSMNA